MNNQSPKLSTFRRVLINLICNLPWIKNFVDKELLSEKLEKVPNSLLYVILFIVIVLMVPVAVRYGESGDFIKATSTIASLANHYIMEYYLIGGLLICQGWFFFRIRRERVLLGFSLVLIFVEVFALGVYGRAVLLEAKYLVGPFHALKLYSEGDSNSAKIWISNLKTERNWPHLTIEMNQFENKLISSSKYGHEIEKKILDLSAHKDYLELLDLIVFLKKLDPGNKSMDSQLGVIKTKFATVLRDCTSSKVGSDEHFSYETDLLNKLINKKSTGLYGYDSTLVESFLKEKGWKGLVEDISNREIIDSWIMVDVPGNGILE